MNADTPGKRVLTRIWFSAAILCIALLFVLGGLQLQGDAGKFPVAVGTITAVLTLLELLLRLREKDDAGESPDDGKLVDKVWVAGWFLASLACFYILGVVLAIAVSATAYFYAFIWRRPLWALGAGVAHAVFFWLAFDVLAGFRLYQGILGLF